MIDSDGLVRSFREGAARILGDLGGEVTTLCEPDPPAGSFFIAEAIAAHPIGRVRVWFGDREFEVRTSVRPSGRPWPIDLTYYLIAMGRDSSAASDSMWIHTHERLDEVLMAQREALEICLSELASDPVLWWRLADEKRLSLEAESRGDLRRRELAQAADRAATAFQDGDFGRVIALLGPYSDILSEAQALRLRLAQKRRSD